MSKNRTQAIKFRDLLLIIRMITQIIIVGLLYISRDFYEEKKPLVYTPRIKRLYTTTILIYVIIAILCNLSIVISNNIVYQTLAITLINLLIIFTMYLVYIVNFINSPIENMISRKFYKMSQKKLEEMPNLKIIGITGSYGKTSTKYALTTLLKQKYNVCMTPENFNTLSGVERAINENLKSTDQIFVCEMGAKNIGDIKEICDLVHPTYGVLTAIGPQHLETFKTIENVRKTKMELIDSLPKEGKAFINYEDENIKATKVEKNNIKYGSYLVVSLLKGKNY
jgi:UDP-N-acetylmuramoyl-tripeptide--D-alanyl-D-alanine ligase